MTYRTPQEAADAMHAKLKREIRAEHDLLAGWRRRHATTQNPEERAELEQWAANAHASIEALNEQLKQLRPPDSKAA